MDTTSVPIFMTKEGEWFVACCPMLDLATQGRTEEVIDKLSGPRGIFKGATGEDVERSG